MRERLEEVSGACIRCDLCEKECAFLRKYGKPKDIADRYDPALKEDQGMPFECSLCGLCTAVCPVGVDPSGLFLQMRRESARRGEADYPEHGALIGYERRGTSRRYSYYGLPEGCDTVFFPGCTLSGTRSEKVIQVYQKLRDRIPSLGIVLDCCMKPSHDLGREEHFNAMFEEMKEYLVEHGVRTVLVACPNCFKVFARYGEDLTTTTVYELLGEDGIEGAGQASEKVAVHDPCAVRFHTAVHASVRTLIRKSGQDVKEMSHAGRRTICCGEGGAVGALAPNFAGHWAKLCQEEAAGRRVVTYCAGCVNTLSKFVPTVHVLDTLWAEKGHRPKVTKPPFTYWKRLRLKKWFKRHVVAAVTRERTFTGAGE
jgi:Fe-S oxidoreductase